MTPLSRFRIRRADLPVAVFFGMTALYFIVFWSRTTYIDAENNFVTTHLNIWGDWAAHFTMGSAMTFRRLLLTESPFLYEAPFLYPFFTNLLSAVLARLGVPFTAAFVVPSAVFSIALVAAIFAFYWKIFRSRATAIVGSLIFFLNGGMGFLQFFDDIAAEGWRKALLAPYKMYTDLETHGIHWLSIIDSMVIPQRAFQFGVPLAILTLLGALRWLHGRSRALDTPWYALPATRAGLGAAALLGFLPVAHTHSFLAVGVILAFWIAGSLLAEGNFTREEWKRWFAGGLLFALFFVPLFATYFAAALKGGGKMEWYPGWYATEERRNWFAFWWANWGVTLPLSLAGAWWWVSRSQERTFRFFLVAPFFVLFALTNLIKFQPWLWDNTKLNVWAAVGISGLAGHAVVQLYRSEPANRWLSLKPTAAVLLVLATFSGTLDAYTIFVRSLRQAEDYVMYSQEDLYLAEWMRRATPLDAVIMTNHSQHNAWAPNLTGRQPLMAYEGWIWTHGYDYTKVKAAVMKLYHRPERSELLDKLSVDYIVLGPTEVHDFAAKEEEFLPLFTRVKKTQNYAVFAVNPPAPLGTLPPVRVRGARPKLYREHYRGRYPAGLPVWEEYDETVAFNLNHPLSARLDRPTAIRWTGYLKVDAPGRYEFFLGSDDGALLVIDDRDVLDNGFEHAYEERSASVELDAGYHRFQVDYFDSGGGAELRLEWEGPGQARGPIPADRFFH